MGKLTKKDRIKVLEWQVKTLIQSMTNIEEWSSCADNMLTELNHALPDPEYDAKREAQEADIDASLDRHRERLGLNKPQLKQLDQSVFNGLDEKWRFAAVDGCTGRAYVYEQKPHFFHGKDYWRIHEGLQRIIGHDYDASNWQNSLIERDTAELTGSELCRAMLERGDKYIMCFTSCASDDNAISNGRVETVIFEAASSRWNFETVDDLVIYAVPINNQGKPLTASEVGL